MAAGDRLVVIDPASIYHRCEGLMVGVTQTGRVVVEFDWWYDWTPRPLRRPEQVAFNPHALEVVAFDIAGCVA